MIPMQCSLIPRFRPLALALALLAAVWLPAGAQQPGAAARPVADAVLALPVSSGPAGAVTGAEVELMVDDLIARADRPAFWRASDTVARFARSLYIQRAMAAAAVREGLGQNMAQGAAERLLRERELAELYMQRHVAQAMPSESAIETFARSEYQLRPDLSALPEEIRVRHILVPVAADGSDDAQAKARAEQLLGQLRQGGDFAALAREHSGDPGSARRGGDLDWFARGRMVPSFEAAAFALKQPGALSEPVKSPFGYHVIELLERKPAARRPFGEVLPEIRREIETRINAQERRRLWDAEEKLAQTDDAAVKRLMARHQAETRP